MTDGGDRTNNKKITTINNKMYTTSKSSNTKYCLFLKLLK